MYYRIMSEYVLLYVNTISTVVLFIFSLMKRYKTPTEELLIIIWCLYYAQNFLSIVLIKLKWFILNVYL